MTFIPSLSALSIGFFHSRKLNVFGSPALGSKSKTNCFDGLACPFQRKFGGYLPSRILSISTSTISPSLDYPVSLHGSPLSWWRCRVEPADSASFDFGRKQCTIKARDQTPSPFMSEASRLDGHLNGLLGFASLPRPAYWHRRDRPAFRRLRCADGCDWPALAGRHPLPEPRMLRRAAAPARRNHRASPHRRATRERCRRTPACSDFHPDRSAGW